MSDQIGIAVLSIILFALGNPSQDQQTVVVKGVIVAYHEQDRAFNVQENYPIGATVERWIVRVLDSDPRLQDQLIVVQYQRLRDRMSDQEIESGALMMKLTRSSGEDVRECIGTTFLEGDNIHVREATAKDFKKTSLGTDVKLPKLDTLPCFTTSEQPTPTPPGP